MKLTLLLDLDDTLLKSNMESFIPAYFQALGRELEPYVAPELMVRALIAGTNSMNESEDFSRTLEEVFSADFYSKINTPREELEGVIQKFYRDIFPSLSGLTSPVPTSKPLIDWAISRGFRIVIATDPLFPCKATSHRIRWAGFDPSQFDLVSTFDHFHFTKTHPAYYAEVLGYLGWPEGPVLMVGNDMDRDILPAQKLGLKTYLVRNGDVNHSTFESGFQGRLDELRPWLESIDTESLIPEYKSRDSVLGLLLSTPAVLLEWARSLEAEDWCRKPSSQEWSFTELICHLRDTEREVFQMQIELFDGQQDPFIPRPDTSVWASLRDYIREEGQKALQEFVVARSQTMKMINTLPDEAWNRTARHAIFGPTNFLEAMGFMGDHDRMHVQQAWMVLGKSSKSASPPIE